MKPEHHKLVKVLCETRQFLARPENNFDWSTWEDASAALREMDEIIARIESGSLPPKSAIEILFAPTGPIQEASVSSGWGEEFIELANRFDRVVAQAYSESVLAQLKHMLRVG